ncbi:MAG: Clp protease ClpP [Alistipes sp.]|nr:Clp protease ClpP [Alistipes sp.]MBR6662739.1 Clp protease ClpP [Alistipes sp.]MBR7097611.1 Clp protease ClpP [Alistipes sp.]
MQTKITIRNEAQTCYIDIEGVIGVSEQSQFENATSSVATFEAFRQEVERIKRVAATSVVVNIRSTGGDVNDALLIYDALQSLDARITTRCYGYTASAATIIAQAANAGCREISSNALYLIHNSHCSIEGNASSLEARAELLRKTDERLAYLYAQHSGQPVETFVALMAENSGEGRWLTAEETVEAGLADKIIDGLMVGTLLPEQNDAQDNPSDTSSQSGEVAAQSDLPQNISKKELAKAVDSAAAAVVRYLMRRFSYRWEKLVEGWREKREKRENERKSEREIKREQKRQSKQTSGDKAGSAEVASSAEVACPTGAACPAETVHSAETAHSLENVHSAEQTPQAAVSRSVVAFDSGQRLYKRSEVKAVEDPSMNRLRSAANQQAYADDVRAFNTLR